MNATEPDWNLYRSFLAVLQEGSLSGAARALGLAQPTLARHLDALEAALGVQLFLRSQRGLSPTEAALALQPHAGAMAAAGAALLRTASGRGEGAHGTVRIGASEVVGIEVLPPILAGLRARHPGLAFELAVSNEVEDLLRRDADIAVRMVAPAQGALLARRLGAVPLGLHARRDYLQRAGMPESLQDLARHSLIGFDRETAAIRALIRRMPAVGEAGFERARFAFRCDSDAAQLAAIRAGFGIGVCQLPLAARQADLVHLLPDAFRVELEVWLAMHEDLRTTPRCRAAFDGLADGLLAYLRGS